MRRVRVGRAEQAQATGDDTRTYRREHAELEEFLAGGRPSTAQKEKPVVTTGFLERIMSLVKKTLEKRF